jgi:predicted dehydrogenase/nucleoside-diphosphate-sugar epimerase
MIQELTKSVRLAVLGGGAVTQQFYLPAARLLDDVHVAAVVDPSIDTGSTSAGEGVAAHAPQPLSMTFQEFLADRPLLRDLELDAVVVALPNALHEAAVTEGLSAGLHVLCEKPLSLEEVSCLRIAQAGQEARKIVAVGMVRRLLPSVTALRCALAGGLLGELQTVGVEDGGSFHWAANSGSFFRAENGGVLTDLGIHYLDLLTELLGPLEPVRYTDDFAGGCEANALFHLRTHQGVPVRLALSRDRGLGNAMRLTGSKGTLEVRKGDETACAWLPAEPLAVKARLTPRSPFARPDWPLNLVSCFAQQLWEFARAVRGSSPVRVTPHDAAQKVRLIEWAYRQRQAAPGRTTGRGASPGRAGRQVVVTGGTGFIGGRLVERLTAEEEWGRVIVPVRNYQTCVQAARFPVDLPSIDLLDPASTRRALAGAHHVFHLAYGSGRDAARVTIEGTRNVVEAAIEDGAESVVVLSTINVFGYPDADRLVDESWPYSPAGGEYGRSKAVIERWCLRRARSSGPTRVVVLNPSCVYGIGGKTFTRMPVEFARQNAFCLVEGGRGIANYTYVDNLVDAILLACRCEAAHGKRFLINDGWCTWAEFFTLLLGPAAAGLPSYTKAELANLARSQPGSRWRDIVRAATRSPELMAAVSQHPVLGRVKRLIGERFPRLVQRLRPQPNADGGQAVPLPRPVPPAWLSDLFGPTTTRFSADQARRVLGWQPRVSLEEGQRRTVAWLWAQGLDSESQEEQPAPSEATTDPVAI